MNTVNRFRGHQLTNNVAFSDAFPHVELHEIIVDIFRSVLRYCDYRCRCSVTRDAAGGLLSGNYDVRHAHVHTE